MADRILTTGFGLKPYSLQAGKGVFTYPSAPDQALTYLHGAAPPAAPSNVRIALQSVTVGGQASNSIPPAPNSQTVAWESVTGATQYGIYKQTYTDLGVISSAYPALGSPTVTVTAASASSAWSTYVSGQGSGIGVVPGCNCAYVDSSATNCATYTYLDPPAYANLPDGQVNGANADGVYLPNTNCTYRVTATVGGVESAMSSDSSIVLLANGQLIMIGGNFSPVGSFTWADTTCPVASPLGYTTNMKFAYSTATYNYNDWWTVNGCTNANLGISGYNYFNLSVYPGQSGSSLAIQSEIWKDYVLSTHPINLSTWGPASPPTGQWTTYKIPISTLQNNVAGGSDGGTTGNNVVQRSFYKPVLVNTLSNNTDYFWHELSFTVT